MLNVGETFRLGRALNFQDLCLAQLLAGLWPTAKNKTDFLFLFYRQESEQRLKSRVKCKFSHAKGTNFITEMCNY